LIAATNSLISETFREEAREKTGVKMDKKPKKNVIIKKSCTFAAENEY